MNLGFVFNSERSLSVVSLQRGCIARQGLTEAYFGTSPDWLLHQAWTFLPRHRPCHFKCHFHYFVNKTSQAIHRFYWDTRRPTQKSMVTQSGPRPRGYQPLPWTYSSFWIKLDQKGRTFSRQLTYGTELSPRLLSINMDASCPAGSMDNMLNSIRQMSQTQGAVISRTKATRRAVPAPVHSAKNKLSMTHQNRAIYSTQKNNLRRSETLQGVHKLF